MGFGVGGHFRSVDAHSACIEGRNWGADRSERRLVVYVGDNDTNVVTNLFLCFGMEKSVPAGDELSLLIFSRGDNENEKR